MQKRQPKEIDNHFVAGYLFCLLIYFPLLLLGTIIKLCFDSDILLGGTEKEITLKLLFLATVLFALTYGMFIRQGRWRTIVKEFSRLDSENVRKADRAYKIFVCLSFAALMLSLATAFLVGVQRT